MMWFSAYAEKEGLGIEHPESVRSALCGLYILGFLKKQNVNLEGFRIYLLSGSLSASWEEKICQKSERNDFYFLKLADGNFLIATNAKGYVRLHRMGVPVNQMKQPTEIEVYGMIKQRKENQ